MVKLARHQLCPTTKGNVLNPVRVTLIIGLMDGYKFDVGEFLDQEIRDRAVGSEKLLLAYPCMITQVCLVVGE